MIRSVDLKPFKKSRRFSAYLYKNRIKTYMLRATVTGGYKITRGKIIVGDSFSGGRRI